MFTLLGKAFTYLVESTSVDRTKLENELQKNLEKLNNDTENEDSDEEESKANKALNNCPRPKETEEQVCFRKTGILTKLDTKVGVIDNQFCFSVDLISAQINHLEIGSKIAYLVYKNDKDKMVKIKKILSIVNEAWDKSKQDIEKAIEDAKNDEIRKYIIRTMIILGEISEKDTTHLFIETINDHSLKLKMDDVVTSFIPMAGDKIEMDCKVQFDEEIFDFTGEIVEVLTIRPQRSKTIKGVVTFLNEYYGTVDNQYIFFPEILIDGVRITTNSNIIADAIESVQGKYAWRCLKLVLSESDDKEHSDLINSLLEKSKENNKNSINSKIIEERYLISITDGLEYEFDRINQEKLGTIIIQNNHPTKPHKLLAIYFTDSKANSHITLKDWAFKNRTLYPTDIVRINLSISSKYYGYSSERIRFQFEGFFVFKHIAINVGIQTTEINPTNKNNSKYRSNTEYTRNVLLNMDGPDFVPGTKTIQSSRFLPHKIPPYHVPEILKNTMLNSAKTLVEIEQDLFKISPIFNEPLNFRHYVEKFDILVHLEEIHMFHCFRKYDMDNAIFHREGEYLSLYIENVLEQRPSITIGDSVKVETLSTGNKFKLFEGFIHKVLNNRILLKFNASFHEGYNGESYKVIFYFSRSVYRKQHFAIRQVHKSLGPDFLFPYKLINKPPQLDCELHNDDLVVENNRKLPWFNPELNIIQKAAIKNILRGEVRPMPYVIFGPPGTGKTITVIETILQILKHIPSSRILVGTPSNSSADLILERIIQSGILKKGEFIRIVSQSAIEREQISPHLQEYCAKCDMSIESFNATNATQVKLQSGGILNLNRTQLGQHRLTIGTCFSLSQLFHFDFPKNHFTHVIIDEAGQCSETETMIPAMFLDLREGQIILAGDPMQLGPTIFNKIANENGLHLSFLGRLLERVPYQRDKQRFKHEYDQRLVTKLLYNYRALPCVMKLYSDLFYTSSLISVVSDTDSIEAKNVARLKDVFDQGCPDRDHNFSVFFHGLRGQNLQLSDSPSWFNSAEATQLFEFVIKLYQKGFNSLDIGIITPYNQQCRVIRRLFEEAELDAPKVGSVEEFQGQERQIILISTVRSTKHLAIKDRQNAIGFVGDVKRINVAISRTRALLVIFGNPFLLSIDQNWRHIINYCVQHNTYLGCNLPEIFKNKTSV